MKKLSSNQIEQLQEIKGLDFFPSIHRYKFNNRWVKYSISQIVDTRPKAVKIIHDRTRSQWEPRGNHVHACLEKFLKNIDFDPGDYLDIIKPLTEYHLFERWECIASEYRLVQSLRPCRGDLLDLGGIAGSVDCILKHKEKSIFAIADLKTLSKSGRERDITGQLGGYLMLFNHCHPDIKISKCFGIWAKPGKTWTTSYQVSDCLNKYNKLESDFLSKQLFF